MDSLSAPEQKEKWFISKNTHDERDGKPSPDLIDKLSLKLITAHWTSVHYRTELKCFCFMFLHGFAYSLF